MDIKSIISAVTTVLGGIKSIAAAGKDTTSAVSAAVDVFTTVKDLIAAGKDARELLAPAVEAFKKGDGMTDADITAMRARIDALRAELHAPLPAPEPGEED